MSNLVVETCIPKHQANLPKQRGFPKGFFSDVSRFSSVQRFSLLARAVYLCIFYSRRMITFHCLIYFQLSYFFLVVLIIPQILWNNRFLINADQMSYSTLYWVGQKVCLSFSFWCLVGEQQVFAEYILKKTPVYQKR